MGRFYRMLDLLPMHPEEAARFLEKRPIKGPNATEDAEDMIRSVLAGLDAQNYGVDPADISEYGIRGKALLHGYTSPNFKYGNTGAAALFTDQGADVLVDRLGSVIPGGGTGVLKSIRKDFPDSHLVLQSTDSAVPFYESLGFEKDPVGTNIFVLPRGKEWARSVAPVGGLAAGAALAPADAEAALAPADAGAATPEDVARQQASLLDLIKRDAGMQQLGGHLSDAWEGVKGFGNEVYEDFKEHPITNLLSFSNLLGPNVAAQFFRSEPAETGELFPHGYPAHYTPALPQYARGGLVQALDARADGGLIDSYPRSGV